jgi:hypothetical protein
MPSILRRNLPMNRRTHLALLITALSLCFFFAAACGHSQPIQVLPGPPSFAYRTLGMVSGQGENESSAMAMVLDQASRLEADAVIVESRRPVGHVVILTCRAIKYLAPPPAQ